MTGDELTLQAPYVPARADPAGAARSAGGRDAAGAVAIRDSIRVGCRDRQVAALGVGAMVEWIINQSGWKVTERSGDAPVA